MGCETDKWRSKFRRLIKEKREKVGNETKFDEEQERKREIMGWSKKRRELLKSSQPQYLSGDCRVNKEFVV